jgi:hypothetical protein
MRRERRTQEYFARPPLAKPGKSKREIIRCLKRYVATATVKSLDPAAFMDKAAIDYVLAV